MRRALVAIAVLGPMTAAVYACTTDDFTNDGGAEAGVESGVEGGVTQAEFCAAEALYFSNCGYDAACAQTDLKSCGALFAAFSNGFAAALAHCMEIIQLPCSGEFTKTLGSPCITQELTGYVNDSGVLAAFANDFCNACDKGSSTCAGKFASAANQPGYIPSLFSDGVIQQMDNCEKNLDGGVILTPDGSVSCLQQTLLCEYYAIGNAGPPSACTDQ
jgi:hypothetical protein